MASNRLSREYRPTGGADFSFGRADGVQRQRAAGDDAEEHQNVGAAGRVAGEGMHAGEHARAHQEGAEQAQRESGNRQQQRPGGKGATLFGDRLRVDQRRADQPGHERGVFDRVPEPPATPAQFVIGPPAAQRDADGQEGPGDIGPRPRPAHPLAIHPTIHQCGDGEGESHGEADVTHVQHRRMHDQAEILQQRIQVIAVRQRRHMAFERVAGEGGEADEADGDHTQRSQRTRHEALGQLVAERGQRHGPQAQGQHPQQQRAFVGAPHSADAVALGQLQVGILRHVGDRKILGDEAPGQHDVGTHDEYELTISGRSSDPHQRRIIQLGADQRHHRLHCGQQQCQDQEDLTELGHHGLGACSDAFCALPLAIASATSLGM